MRPWLPTSPSAFGEYPIDGLEEPPEALDPNLQLLASTDVIDAEAA